MKWFKNIQTVEELKKEYKRLACKHHPDIQGGSEADMKEINSEYDALFEELKNIHQAADGTTYEAKTATTETPEEFRDIIEALIHLDGISIELCGSWLWVSGNTYPHREALKNLKFRYSRSKKAWYYHTAEYHKTSHKTYSMNQIRDLYGSEIIATEAIPRIAEA